VCKLSTFLHCRYSVLGKGRATQTEHRNGCKHQHRFTYYVFFWGLLTRANNNYLLGGYVDRRSRSRQLQIFHADEPTFIEAQILRSTKFLTQSAKAQRAPVGSLYTLQNSTQFAKHQCADRGEQFLPHPPSRRLLEMRRAADSI